MPDEHSLFSASDSPRWTRCYGALAFTKDIPNRGSASADEGTAAHTLAASVLEDPDCRTAWDYQGDRIDAGARTFEVTREMAEAVHRYALHVQDLAAGGEMLVEQRVNYSRFLGVDAGLGWGTSDAVIMRADGELIIVDLKYGANPKNRVDAEDNDQLRLYALGAWDSFSMLGDFDRVRMVIVQPRLDHVSEWVQTVDELKAWAVSAKMAAAHAHAILQRGEPKADELTPGDKQCKWCSGKATCPAARAKIEQDIAADFGDLDASPVPHVAARTDDALGLAMASVEYVEAWCKAVRAETERRLLAGTEVQGWKLIEGRMGSRAWSDADAAEAMLKSFRLKVEEMYDLKLISPTSAEKLAKAQAIGPKQWAKAQALIDRSPGKPSVAPASHKAPALVITPTVDAFANLEEESLA
jgi:hypothetical protein